MGRGCQRRRSKGGPWHGVDPGGGADRWAGGYASWASCRGPAQRRSAPPPSMARWQVARPVRASTVPGLLGRRDARYRAAPPQQGGIKTAALIPAKWVGEEQLSDTE